MASLTCFLCLRQLRERFTTCNYCESSLSIWKHLDRHGLLIQGYLHHILYCCHSDLPMLEKSISSVATTLSCSRNGLAPGMYNKQKLIVTMKRSMGFTSSDKKCDKLSGLSSKDSSPSLDSGDEENGVRKHARADKKAGSASRAKRGSSTNNMEAEVVMAEVQQSKSTSSMTAPLLSARESLTSQVQQLFRQSSSSQPDSLYAASHYANYGLPSEPLGYTYNAQHPSATHSYGQTFAAQQAMSSTCQQPGVQPWPWGLVTYPGFYYPVTHMQPGISAVASSQSYHSSSQNSAVSQAQRKSRVEVGDSKQNQHDVTNQDSDLLSMTSNQEKVNASRTEKRSMDVSQLGTDSSHAEAAVYREADVDNPLSEKADVESQSLDDYKAEKYRKILKQLPREWELTAFGEVYNCHHRVSRNSRQPVEFKVMTYNILSQDLLENHSYLYSGSKSRSLDWRHRRRRLIAEIACHNPDILNLQEVHRDHFFEYMKPRLQKLGYEGSYVKRTGDKNDGCATMWKKDKFRLLRSTPVTYCRGGLLDRDNIAVIAELQPVRSGHDHNDNAGETEDKLVIANTHLLFNPRRGDIKLAQLMILMAEIDRHAYLGPSHEIRSRLHPYSWDTVGTGRYCPIVVTGDFNMEPHSEMYKFMVSGQMDYEGLLVRQISGQEEGMYGRNQLLDRNFFSPRYGVSDFCQYHMAVVGRLKDSCKMDNDALPAEGADQSDIGSVSQSQTESNTTDSSSTEDSLSKCPPPMPINTGRLWHHLNLVSAYRHRVKRLGNQMEVTTHHNNGKCSVDYIFYTVCNKEVRFQRDEVRLSKIQDGKLKLIARYGLMSAKELDNMGGIPNPVLPSDHLCLIARFLLM